MLLGMNELCERMSPAAAIAIVIVSDTAVMVVDVAIARFVRVVVAAAVFLSTFVSKVNVSFCQWLTSSKGDSQNIY